MAIIQGIIKKKFPIEFVGEKQTAKQILVIKLYQKYDNEIPIEFIGTANTDILTSFSENDTVNVWIDICGREWKGKWYASLKGRSIEFPKEVVNKSTGEVTQQKEADLPF